MIVFPNGKINLGLNIVARRPDGYHDLQSGFYPVPWCDVLEILPAAQNSFQATGIPIPGEPGQNLVMKGWELLNNDFGISPITAHLQKNIPIGAGLGGGSSDGAFALKAMNELFSLGLSNHELEHYAQQLGSDCPFFIENRPAYVTGTGNVFQELACSLSGKFLLVAYPQVHISTGEAYAGITPKQPKPDTLTVLHKPLTEWKGQLTNDFAENLMGRLPIIGNLCDQFYRAGAQYAAMTGSGSAVYAIFEQPTQLDLPENYPAWQGVLP